MGKISQNTEREVSHKICKPILEKKQEVINKRKELLTKWYRDTVPADVMKFFAKHKEYVKTDGSVYVQGIGIETKWYGVESSPDDDTNSYSNPFKLNKEQSIEFSKLLEQEEDLSTKYNTTQKEIEATMLALGTHKRIAEQFPEAAEFLPEAPKQNMQLMVQLKPVRENVKCLISTDKDKKCISKL